MTEAAGSPLLLDTHVMIWAVEGNRAELSRDAVERIQAASQRGEVWISAISIWEVAMLEAKGRISLSRDLDEWVAAALRAPGTRLLELSPAIAIDSTRLPGTVPGDPADRILIASARASGAALATRDRAIVRYARTGFVDVLDCEP